MGKDLNNHLSKEDLQMANKQMKKNALNHLSLEDYRSKQQRGTAAHLLEWAGLRTPTTPGAGKDAEQQEPPVTACGKADGAATLAASSKTKCSPVTSKHAPWYLLQGAESLCPQEDLHMDVQSGFIHRLQKLETTKMSFSG